LREIDYKKEYLDESGRLYIRPMTEEDVPDFVRWRNSDIVRNFYIYRADFTVEGQKTWMKNNVDTGKAVMMIMCLAENDHSIGCVYVQNIDKTHSKAEYGIMIGEAEAQGKGYGTSAAKLMLKYCFEELKLHRIYLRALEGNERATRSYEKAGFVKEGFLKDDVIIDGEYRSVVWMAAVSEK
jgi:diamine N-acetyltransferase